MSCSIEIMEINSFEENPFELGVNNKDEGPRPLNFADLI